SPLRQTWCGGTPVTSRPFSATRPASARRWPVIRLNSVVLPAPLGPMMALTLPFGTSNETRETATKPSNDLVRSRTSSTPRPPDPAAEQLGGAGQPAGEAEQQDDQDDAEHERPVLRVRDHLLADENQRVRAQGRAQQRAQAAEQRNEEAPGRLAPVP